MGKALVTFQTKDEGILASQKLYFEDELGLNIEIDFYQHDIKFQKIQEQE